MMNEVLSCYDMEEADSSTGTVEPDWFDVLFVGEVADYYWNKVFMVIEFLGITWESFVIDCFEVGQFGKKVAD